MSPHQIGRVMLPAAAALAALLTPPGPASAAEPPGPDQIAGSIAPPALTPEQDDGGEGVAAAGCNRFTRTALCTDRRWSLTLLLNGRPVGSATGNVVQHLTLNPKRRTFSERFSFHTTAVTGQAAGTRASFNVGCGRGCSASSTVPRVFTPVPGRTVSGAITYTDHVARGVKHITAGQYSVIFVKPGFTPGRIGWKSLEFRCDDTLPGYNAGCVFPEYAPTLTTMAALPNIAAGIRRIQTNSPGHYGRPGSGHPLTRNPSETARRANYNAVCRGRTAPPGSPGPSCDEYPFASTYQGGTALGPHDRGITWVPVREQNSQGARIKNFYFGNRVLNKDPFYVAV